MVPWLPFVADAIDLSNPKEERMAAVPSRSSRGRLTTLVACLTISAGVLVPAVAVAKPTVTLSAHAASIPKNLLEPHSRAWPHTGDFAGAGAEFEATFTIQGTEYQGLPNPLRRVGLYLPRGTTIHTHGFGTCRPSLSGWQRVGPNCPKGSFASVPGPELDRTDFTGSVVPTQWEQGAFFPAGGGLEYWTHTVGGPFLAGGFNKASLAPATGAYGYKLTETLPARNTEFGGNVSNLTTSSLDLTLGAAYMKGGKLVSIVTMPKICPAGGLPIRAELSFGTGAEPSWETVSFVSKLPCSRR